MVNLVDHLEAVDVGAGREEEKDDVPLRNLAGINGEAAVVAQVIDVGGMTRHVLHEEAIAVARMGLVAVLGISGNLNPGRVGLALACSGPHAVVTQGVFPVDEVADRAVQELQPIQEVY